MRIDSLHSHDLNHAASWLPILLTLPYLNDIHRVRWFFVFFSLRFLVESLPLLGKPLSTPPPLTLHLSPYHPLLPGLHPPPPPFTLFPFASCVSHFPLHFYLSPFTPYPLSLLPFPLYPFPFTLSLVPLSLLPFPFYPFTFPFYPFPFTLSLLPFPFTVSHFPFHLYPFTFPPYPVSRLPFLHPTHHPPSFPYVNPFPLPFYPFAPSSFTDPYCQPFPPSQTPGPGSELPG